MPLAPIDVQANIAVSREAQAVLLSPGYGLTSDDYPPAALAIEQEGRVVVRLVLDEKGAIAACEIALSSGSEALDEGTCTALRKRARFAPAKDMAGKPRQISYYAPVTWVIPPADGDRILSQSLVVTATFGPDIVMRGCDGRIGGYAASFSSADCAHYAYLFPLQGLAIATGDGEHGVRLTAEERREYSTSARLPATVLNGIPLMRLAVSFQIDRQGRPGKCVMTDRRGAAMRGGFSRFSPCRADQRFDVGDLPDASFPIRAAWTTTLVYASLESSDPPPQVVRPPPGAPRSR